MDTDVKRPVWLKQMPRALNIPESNPHPTASSPPQCLTQSAQTASNPPCDEEIILSKRSELWHKVSAALSRHPHPETLEVLAPWKCRRHSGCICRGPARPGVPTWSSCRGTLHCIGGMASQHRSPSLPKGTPRHAQHCAPADSCLPRRH